MASNRNRRNNNTQPNTVLDPQTTEETSMDTPTDSVDPIVETPTPEDIAPEVAQQDQPEETVQAEQPQDVVAAEDAVPAADPVVVPVVVPDAVVEAPVVPAPVAETPVVPEAETTSVDDELVELQAFLKKRSANADISQTRQARTIALMKSYVAEMAPNKPQTPRSLATHQRQLFSTIQYAAEGNVAEAAQCLDTIGWFVQKYQSTVFSARMRHRQGDSTYFSYSDAYRLNTLLTYLANVATSRFSKDALMAGASSNVHQSLPTNKAKENMLRWMQRN